MGRDVMVYAYGGPLLPVDEMPPGWRPRPMGSRREVRARLQAVLGEVDWSQRSWGLWRGPRGAWLEVHLLEVGPADLSGEGRETVGAFRAHVGGGTEATAQLLRLCGAHGWAALDPARGAWLAAEAPAMPPPTPEDADRFVGHRDALRRLRLARQEH